MDEDLEYLIREKEASDKRQRIKSLVIILISIVTIFIIYFAIIKKEKINQTLTLSLDTAKTVALRNDSVVSTLKKTLIEIKEEKKEDIVVCTGVPAGTRTSKGLPKYNFTFRIKDSSLVSQLDSVDYYFADDSYNPKLKRSTSAKTNFRIYVPDSWGCMPILPVYFHYKQGNIDTIYFPMCEKSKIIIPKI